MEDNGLTNNYKYSFINPDPALKDNLMAFGYECGEGWYKLINDCFDKIEERLKNNPQVFKVLQVKEKFGGLRIYFTGGDKFIEDAIRQTCKKSYETCENCGSSEEATTVTICGWLYTRCKKCEDQLKDYYGILYD
jgi:hypothetical protein